MTVFFVISTELGGAERSLLEFLQSLGEESKNILVVVPKDHGPFIDELNKLIVRWECLPLPQGFLSLSRNRPGRSLLLSPLVVYWTVQQSLQISHFLKKHQASLVHSTGIKYHLLLSLALLLTPQVRLKIHLRDIISNPLLRWFFRLSSWSQRIQYIANSKATALSVAPVACRLIYNGFPKASKTSDISQEVAQLKQNKPYLVGIVGALAHWKGQAEFIRMAKLLEEEREDIHFVIVGDEIYDTLGESGEKQRLINLSQQLQLKNISFLPFQKNTAPIYKALTVLVHASTKAEPFGRVIVEAMIHGCPVTASDAGGPREIIQHQSNGLLHKPGDPQSMAINVKRMLDDDNLRRNLATCALTSADIFSMKNYVTQLRQELEIH